MDARRRGSVPGGTIAQSADQRNLPGRRDGHARWEPGCVRHGLAGMKDEPPPPEPLSIVIIALGGREHRREQTGMR